MIVPLGTGVAGLDRLLLVLVGRRDTFDWDHVVEDGGRLEDHLPVATTTVATTIVAVDVASSVELDDRCEAGRAVDSRLDNGHPPHSTRLGVDARRPDEPSACVPVVLLDGDTSSYRSAACSAGQRVQHPRSALPRTSLLPALFSSSLLVLLSLRSLDLPADSRVENGTTLGCHHVTS